MKKKKEKITYIDDGRTIADMSGVAPAGASHRRDPATPRPRVKEVLETYWAATKMMFLPMLVVVGAICLIYLILTLVFTLMY